MHGIAYSTARRHSVAPQKILMKHIQIVITTVPNKLSP